MTSAFNSTLSWLDSNERERRAVLELVSALSEPGTLDELGIGSVRDTIADALFPGISTIQTRARYFLFIPGSCRWSKRLRPPAPMPAYASCNRGFARHSEKLTALVKG